MFGIFCPSILCGQTAALSEQLFQYTQHSDSVANKYAAENLYLQLDKPYYTIGDTIWFKAYLLSVPSHLFSSRSRLLHIDLMNADGEIIKQWLYPISGAGWGNLALDEKDIKPGNYLLRAYTNWMRNFGYYGFYYKNISVIGTTQNAWLVNSDINVSTIIDGRRKISGTVSLTTMNKTPVADSVLRLEVTTDKKLIYHQAAQTDKNGSIDLEFNLPLKIDNCSITLKSSGQDVFVPLVISNSDKADVQFLPEGGDLVAGINARVGFKAIAQDGKGLNVSGIVSDHTGKTIASFKSLHNGMGSFILLPQPNEVYKARVIFSNGETKDYNLPSVKASGTAISIDNRMEDDSLRVTVAATNDRGRTDDNCFLVARSREIVCYAAVVSFTTNNKVHIAIPKSAFPTGVAHFLLMDADGHPLNERIAFIDHHDDLHIKISPDRSVYEPKDSVRLNINVTDRNGIPVRCDFSLAVTDDAQVKIDSGSLQNILTTVLLTSDLKGYVEDLSYYFQGNMDSWQALDDLLLTQGWVKYEMIDNKVAYPAETEYTVSGTVDNFVNKPVKGTDVTLLSKSPVILMDTLTDSEGRFSFDRFPKIDTPVFVLKTVNKKGRSWNVNIRMDETSPPALERSKIRWSPPWYWNPDSTLVRNMQNKTAYNNQFYNIPGSHALKGVVIKAKKLINGSQNLNGPGNADIILDEHFMEHQGKKSWWDMIEENVGSFADSYRTLFSHDPSIPSYTYEWFFVDGKPAIFIVDGVRLTDVLPPPIKPIDVKVYLQSHNAEDIKGIEVMYSGKYSLRYATRFDMRPFFAFTFVEITTRSGHGPLVGNTPGMYLFKPIPLSWPKQFYKPKYEVSDTTRQADLRSTIDWEPNVITDSLGRAKVSFYAAEKPSTYTVIVEGTDMQGSLGFSRRKIAVVAKKEEAKSQ
ncbi:MAG TPA: hypothetical protein VHE59_02305 [Mucilaginibacter sp.]|nr:hypothetical protein [Mucilaginibacter sp.]